MQVNMATDINYSRCLALGNGLMMASLTIILMTAIIAYGMEHLFTIPVLVTAHIAMIIAAGSLKIGYVMRCIALKAFGRMDF
ncbi:hypothetical protein HBA55_23520 [Pseudomaricurvus alkylphenolicus]|jgi:hypothetical protein|uniref:hypothetical protein n=1 Tax=Pseudomaricurvus alkylphenolicus TaxID=1306991 RepID=UPI00141F0190|nr:hypothetical protein [Pseudomaricurvus alkylphenolicus]NIB42598.1 hypothetical protein [Pseudomaricurvus alkylphenolicus]